MQNDAIPVRSKRLLRTREAAQYLSISSWKLRWLIQDGRIPVVQDGDGSPFLLDLRDLDGYVGAIREPHPFDYFLDIFRSSTQDRNKKGVATLAMKKKELTARELQSLGGKARAAALSPAERAASARKAAIARAASLSPEERSQIAKKATAAREAKRKKGKKRNDSSEKEQAASTSDQVRAFGGSSTAVTANRSANPRTPLTNAGPNGYSSSVWAKFKPGQSDPRPSARGCTSWRTIFCGSIASMVESPSMTLMHAGPFICNRSLVLREPSRSTVR